MKNISEIISLFEYRVLWPSLYAVFKATSKQDKNTVLFADPYSPKLTDNMEPIYAALKEQGGYKLVTCFPKTRENKPLVSTSKPGRIMRKLGDRLSRSRTYIRFLRLYASCGTLILTESFLPAYAVKPRPGTQVVQLWHGCGAFKKWGYSTLDKSFGATSETAELFPMHNCYTLVPISAPEVSAAYAEAFRCRPEIIKPLGVPRTDIYFDTDFIGSAKERLYNSCTALHSLGSADAFSDKTIVLYAPTFRGNSISDASCSVPIDFWGLRSALGDEFVFLCKLHPFAKNSLVISEDCKDFVFDISSAPTDTALCAADILITDYSSIIFEYSLLSRPMLFYAYDLEEYIAERDFYYPYEDFIPGCVVTTENELEIAIRGAAEGTGTQKIADFRNKFMSACDGNATNRIVEHLFN